MNATARMKRMVPLCLVLAVVAAILFLGPGRHGSAAEENALFIDPDGTVRVGTNLVVGGKVAAQSFEGNGSALILEGNRNIDAIAKSMDEKKFDKAGGTVTGNVQVKGLVTSYGRYQRDDNPESTYEINPRYHLSLTGANYGGKTKTIPHDILAALCGDPDGCQIRLGMTRWGNGSETETASVFFTFYYSAADGHWRASSTDAGDASGIDGDGHTQHVRNIWNTCFFTDGTYSGYKDTSDRERGMQLLVWNGNTNPKRTCELTIID
jgi:hypothetical protein